MSYSQNIPNLHSIQEKIYSTDKDYRYMAASDLLKEVSKPQFKPNLDVEAQLKNLLMTALQDKSSDVTELAVKCLQSLSPKMSENIAQDYLNNLMKKLVEKVNKDNSDDRGDVTPLAIKAILENIQFSNALGTQLGQSLLNHVLSGVQIDNFEIKLESLDVLILLLSRFGDSLSSKHEIILEVVQPLLSNGLGGTRKRAMTSITVVSSSLKSEMLDELMNELLVVLETHQERSLILQFYVQCVGGICHSIGNRFSRYLERSIQIIKQLCKSADPDEDGSAELQEQCFVALENMVTRSSPEVKVYLEEIVNLCVEFISYDPNYADDDEDEGEMGGQDGDADGDMDLDMDDGEDDEEDEDGDMDEFSDDDDMSWKVRRASTRCITSIILDNPDAILWIQQKVLTRLVRRFREREESVKLGIYRTFISLLQQSKTCTNLGVNSLEYVEQKQDYILQGVMKQLRESPKTRIGVFQVLIALVDVLPLSILNYLPQLVSGSISSIQERNATRDLKMEVLLFLRDAMQVEGATVFQPYLEQISTCVFSMLQGKYYKIAAEALRVMEQLAILIRPDIQAPISDANKPLASQIITQVSEMVVSGDQDLEVKEAAIQCAGVVLSNVGDAVQDQSQNLMQSIIQCMDNDITRLVAVKAYAKVAESPIQISLDAASGQVLSFLTRFLKMANRSLRLSAIQALTASFTPPAYITVTNELQTTVFEMSKLISDQDFHISALALNAISVILKQQPSCIPYVIQDVIPQAQILLQSQLLQGQALKNLAEFYGTLVKYGQGVEGTDFKSIVDSFLSQGLQMEQQVCQHNVAQVIAHVSQVGDTGYIIQKLLGMSQKGQPNKNICLALFCVGEIGYLVNLNQYANQLKIVVDDALQSDNEDVRTAGAVALGGIAMGDEQYLIYILEKIATVKEQQYLLFKSLNLYLRAFARGNQGRDLEEDQLKQILSALMQVNEKTEETINIVSECLGHATVICPDAVFPILINSARNTEATQRLLACTAMKYVIQDGGSKVDSYLKNCIELFMQLVADPDRHVSKAAIYTLSTIVHHKPQMVQPYLPNALQFLYARMPVDTSLIREIDLGPFKIKEDDGLEMRKAAFECMDMILNQFGSAFDVSNFMRNLKEGLTDKADVQSPCFLMLIKLCSMVPRVVLGALEQLIQPLTKTLQQRIKQDAVKQETDRHEEMIRTCLRAVRAIAEMKEVEGNQAFKQFVQKIVQQQYAAKYQEILQERSQDDNVQ